MFWRGMWLAVAVGLLGLGLLAVIEVPTLINWQLAVVATQIGHWLAPGAGLMAMVAGWRVRRSPMPRLRVGITLLCAPAAALLFLPAVRAWNVARSAPAEMRAAFASADASRSNPWFSWPALYWGNEPAPVQTESFVYARGEDYELSLTVFRPAHSDDTNRHRSVIVLVHGGGWDGGTRTELPAFTRWLVSLGAVVVAVDYRLAPRWTWPAPPEDLRAALAWVQVHATELAIDPESILLFGRSAGAQIALAVAYDPASPRVQGVIAFYGPADLRFAYEHGREDDVLKSPGLLRAYLRGAPAEQPGAYDDASPILDVRNDVPPTLLVHGQLDTLVWHRQSERLAVRLHEAGARHFFLSIPSAVHALEYSLNSPAGQLACCSAREFFLSVTHASSRR